MQPFTLYNCVQGYYIFLISEDTWFRKKENSCGISRLMGVSPADYHLGFPVVCGMNGCVYVTDSYLFGFSVLCVLLSFLLNVFSVLTVEEEFSSISWRKRE